MFGIHPWMYERLSYGELEEYIAAANRRAEAVRRAERRANRRGPRR